MNGYDKKIQSKKQEAIKHSTYISDDISILKYFNLFLKIQFSVLKNAKTHNPLSKKRIKFYDALCKDVSPGGGAWWMVMA